MFSAVIISESLNRPSLLNGLNTAGVYVAEGQDTPKAPIWHLFKVKIEDDRVEAMVQTIADNIRYGWYAHFWNGWIIIVCLERKTFRIPRENFQATREFQEMKAYATAHGVEERYLDLDMRD